MIGIEKKDFDKIINFAKASVKEFDGAEIGGMAILKQDKDGDWIISHPTILKQEVTGSTCTLEKEALANYYTKTMMKHGTDLRFVWWHSHGRGGVFWSPTDEEAIKEFNNSDWSVSLVVNVDAEYVLRIDYWQPIPAKLDKQELDIIGETKFTVPTSITNQVKKFCSKPASIVTTGKNQMSLHNSYSNYGYGYGWGGYNGYDKSDHVFRSYKGEYFTHWQRTALEDTQEELESYADGKLGYLDLVGQVDKANNELSATGRIKLPKEGVLHKLVDKKPNINIMNFYKKVKS